MVDTNHEPVENKEIEKTEVEKTEVVKKQLKAKKGSPAPRDAAAKNKADDKGAVKKLTVKKEGSTPKSTAKQAPPKKQTVATLKKFLKGVWSELKKVHWPNRRELVTFTGVVLVAVTLVAVMIFAVDSILGKLLEVIIPK